MPALFFPSEGLYCFLLDTLALRQAASVGFTSYLPPLSGAGLGGAGGAEGGGSTRLGNKLIVVA